MVKLSMECPDKDTYGYCPHEDPNDKYESMHVSHHEIPYGSAYLPHSCDQWIIGGPEEVKLLIEDLQEILKNNQ